MSKKNHSIVVKLEYPIEWATENGKEEITEVSLRRPRGKDIKGIGKDVSLDDILKVAAKVSSFTPRFFDELDAVDCMRISEVIGDFLDSGPQTGKTSSL